jgi:hypothetical protein
MAEFDDPMARLRALRDEQDKTRKSQSASGRKGGFDDPIKQSVSSVDAAKATKSSKMVGRYAQRTFRLPPEYLEKIRHIARDEIMSIADAERWVVGKGLLAYFELGERPDFERTVQRQVQLPSWEKDEAG